jgi:hypothetical protein
MSDRKRDGAKYAEGLYKNIPPLRAYIERIGAEELNFRRFMKRLYFNHYYAEKCTISITNEGDIKVSAPNAIDVSEFKPTSEEASEIKAALAEVMKDWPTCVPTTDAAVSRLIREQNLNRDDVYIFYTRKPEAKGSDVIFVQYRVIIDGKKNYIPYSYWSHGKWLRMEPEGPLPFWKPREKTKNLIMVHEGAKTARYVTDLLGDKKRLASHPWGERLAEYEHWGMIGGALSPHRSDYEEIKQAQPTQLVYSCDNDDNGKSVLQRFSSFVRLKLTGIAYDSRFPPAWDLADPMPETLYDYDQKNQLQYRGPALTEFEKPATWATETIPTEGKGRPNYIIRSDFASEWYHCVKPEIFIHGKHSHIMFSASEFNNYVRPFSNVNDTASLLLASDGSKAVDMIYSPAHPPGPFLSTKQRGINTHKGTTIVSAKNATDEDAKPFIEFMEYLVPDKTDRDNLLRWCFTLLARPDVKMHYGVLLISEGQGKGKSTLGEKILGPLVGKHNMSSPGAGEIVDSAFNDWCAHKRLAVVHEIYEGHSSKAYNKLKSIITDATISINKKYQAPYEIENWLHIFACSNSERALHLSDDDRRWFIPKITESKKPPKWWEDFHHWLNDQGGLSIIKWYAEKWINKTTPVQSGDYAPPSDAKHDVIRAGYSQGQLLAIELFDHLQSEYQNKPFVIFDRDVQTAIKYFIHGGHPSQFLEKPLAIRKLAKSAGLLIAREHLRSTHIRIITNDPDIANTTKWEPHNWIPIWRRETDGKRIKNEKGGMKIDAIDEIKEIRKKIKEETGMIDEVPM